MSDINGHGICQILMGMAYVRLTITSLMRFQLVIRNKTRVFVILLRLSVLNIYVDLLYSQYLTGP
jgi:hypothetical protein